MGNKKNVYSPPRGHWLALKVIFLIFIFSASCAQNGQFYTNIQRADVFTQLNDNEQLDFLWVLDNSGNMADRMTYVEQNIGTFLTTLSSTKAVDYQMAVTTIDYFTLKGNLISSPTGVTVVKSTDSDPQGEFAAIVNALTDSITSFWTQGLESAYQAVYQHGSQFMRPGVNLVIIFVTGADDYSCGQNCYGIEPEHNTGWVPFTMDRYTTYFQNVKASQNANVQIFPIVGTSASTCGVEDVGSRYITLMSQIGNGGVAGSVCAGDMATSYANVAQTIANRGRIFPLSSQASGNGINVYVNGVLIPYTPSNYTYNATTNSIVFTGYIPPQGSQIEVTYEQNNS